jgi:hypothetical protein
MLRFLLPAAGALLLASAAQAQGLCFGPDLLDGPCCMPTGLSLPNLPPINMQGASICWTACALSGQDCIQLSSSAPAPTPVCGQFQVSLKVADCAGSTQMFGNGLMDYSRTWREQGNTIDPTGTVVGTTYQVWRFLLKLDLSAVAGSVPPACLVPNDLVINPAVFYYGYVDYALDCTFLQMKNSVVLYHGSDWLINFPGISSNLSGANPLNSYALVAPVTGATPFFPTDFLIPPGNLQFDSLRAVGDVNLPGTPAACNHEERTSQGVYQPLGFGCLNPPSLGPIQAAAVFVNGASFCGSNYQSLNLFPTLPWLEMITNSIGAWTGSNDYPGPERVRANEGLFLYRDSCQSGTVGGGQAFEVFYGAETRGGFTASIAGTSGTVVTVFNFLDMCSNWRRPVGTPVILPAIGSVMNSYHVMALNPQ